MPNMKLSQYKNYFLILLIILVPSVFAQQKTQNKLVVAGKIGNNQYYTKQINTVVTRLIAYLKALRKN